MSGGDVLLRVIDTYPAVMPEDFMSTRTISCLMMEKDFK
jgi:hypothetical protein